LLKTFDLKESLGYLAKINYIIVHFILLYLTQYFFLPKTNDIHSFKLIEYIRYKHC